MWNARGNYEIVYSSTSSVIFRCHLHFSQILTSFALCVIFRKSLHFAFSSPKRQALVNIMNSGRRASASLRRNRGGYVERNPPSVPGSKTSDFMTGGCSARYRPVIKARPGFRYRPVIKGSGPLSKGQARYHRKKQVSQRFPQGNLLDFLWTGWPAARER